MSRQEKKTRIRMLPPRIQLQQRDALTGSYPTNVRFSIDGRTGDYNINFNDRYSVVFTSSNTYLPGIGFPVGNIWLTNSSSNDLTSSIVAPGNVRSQVVDGLPFFHFTPGQDLTPFRDNDQPAVDGKSTNNPFFAIGSAVSDIGEGFSSPLWSKNKIEIDLSAKDSTSLISFCQGTGVTKNLAYYNFINKTWEPLNGNHGPRQTNDIGTHKMAFTPSLMTWTNDLNPSNKGVASTTFGFPFHALYAATSSQLLSMKNYINEPFLLEKVVVEFTSSFQSGIEEVFKKGEQFDYNGDPIEFSSSYAINNFFILNQRFYTVSQRSIFSGFYDWDYPKYITTKIPDGNVNTIRDLIGYGSIASFNNAFGWAYTASINPTGLYNGTWKRDLNIIDNITFDATKSLWSGRYELSFSIKVPNKFGNVDTDQKNILSFPKAIANQVFDGGIAADSIGHINNGGSIGLGLSSPSGRNYLSPIAAINPDSYYTPTYSGIRVPVVNSNEYSKICPYLLLPTDNIVFGWAAATLDDYEFIGNVSVSPAPLTSSVYTIAAGPAKVTLYGSYVREGQEYNDGTNQLLSSDCIHEVME